MRKSVNFTFSHFTVLNQFLFLPSTHCLFFCFFFVQPVRFPLSRMWELTTGSTPLDDKTNCPNQQTRRVACFNTCRRTVRTLSNPYLMGSNNGVHAFLKDISPKVNLTAQLEFKHTKCHSLACYLLRHMIPPPQFSKVVKIFNIYREIRKKQLYY